MCPIPGHRDTLPPALVPWSLPCVPCRPWGTENPTNIPHGCNSQQEPTDSTPSSWWPGAVKSLFILPEPGSPSCCGEKAPGYGVFHRLPSSRGCFPVFLAFFSLSLSEGVVCSSLKWFWMRMKMWEMPEQEAEASRQLQVDEEPFKALLPPALVREREGLLRWNGMQNKNCIELRSFLAWCILGKEGFLFFPWDIQKFKIKAFHWGEQHGRAARAGAESAVNFALIFFFPIWQSLGRKKKSWHFCFLICLSSQYVRKETRS